MIVALVGGVVVALLLAVGLWFTGSWVRLWLTARAIRRAETELTTIVEEETVTITDALLVEDSVTGPGASQRLESDPPVGMAIWRLRRATQSGALSRRAGDWETIRSGIACGQVSIDAPVGRVELDPEWLAATDGLESITVADLDRAPRRSDGVWTSPYVDITGPGQTVDLEDEPVLSSTVTQAIRDRDRAYRLEVRSVSAGEQLTVHGRVSVDHGRPVIRGSRRVPLVLSDRRPAETTGALRQRAVKAASAALLWIGIAAAIGYLTLYATA